MALPTHWLDSRFEICDNPEDLLGSILHSPELHEIAIKTLEVGEAQRKRFIDNPALNDASVAQAMRQEFLRRLNEADKSVAVASVS